MLNSDKKDHKFNAVVYVLLTIFALICLIPLIFIISNSISDYNLVAANKVLLIPRSINFTVWKTVLSNEYIVSGFLNTILYTVIGTIVSLFITFTAAYVLARKDFAAKKFVMVIIMITMFVSGGMIPTYLVVDGLGLKDTIWGFILPGCLSVWNLIVTKNYIESTITWEVFEAAKVDGVDDFQCFFKLVLPLCIPIIAIVGMFYAIGYWNSYFNSILYLSDPSMYPLQRVLSDIIISNDISSFGSGGSMIDQGRMIKSIQYVSIVVSTLPILLVYPFISRYMEKGVMLGSIKG